MAHVLSIAGAANARGAGIDLDAVTAELEREGVSSFCDSYHELLGRIEAKRAWSSGHGLRLTGSAAP